MWWKFWDKVESTPGLGVRFRKGEMLPWKNIVFKVSKVEHAKIELEPIATTAKFRKGRDGQMNRKNES